jgi:hypothetical protein
MFKILPPLASSIDFQYLLDGESLVFFFYFLEELLQIDEVFHSRLLIISYIIVASFICKPETKEIGALLGHGCCLK